MTATEEKPWVRVSRQHPCPICEKPDWCTIGEKGVCCMRMDSERPMKNGGYFHPFDGPRPERPLPIANKAHLLKPKPDFKAMLSRWKGAVPAGKMEEIANKLGVSAKSLEMLNTTWSPDGVIGFPMYDGTCSSGENPCGMRLRTMEGAKFAITGSKAGIFFPYGALLTVPSGRIFICEGPTDTAACLDMGLFAFGRSSCRGGVDIVLNALWQLGPHECVVVSDNDGPGVAGADDLFKQIPIPKTRLVPPGKDLRAFVKDGGNRTILEEMLNNFFRK